MLEEVDVKKLSVILAVIVLLAVVAVVPAVAQTDSPLPPPGEDPNPPPVDDGTLEGFLLWIIGGGGAGAVAFWLMEKLPLSGLPSELRRYVSLGLAAGVACLAFVGAVQLGYKPTPVTGQAWLEQLFAIAFLAVTTGQTIHGRLRLRRRAALQVRTIE